ncbi:MAG: SMP-30/gluconolactonase/LRE family protein [Pseudorhodobacter sp.]
MNGIFDDRKCELGEGVLWHPLREQIFWFDILGKRLLTREGDKAREWALGEHVSAAGWIGRDALLIASETALFRFDLTTGTREDIIALEADNPVTRSNDGRADPYGGFWIGTMGKASEPGAGAIYRYYKGELRRLYDRITVPNATCFAPDGSYACFANTDDCQIRRVALDGNGWPKGDPVVHVDTRAEGLRPDGAVIDKAGQIWVAHWGGACVAVYDDRGRPVQRHAVGARQASCPAFGGPEMKSLFVTTAAVGIDAAGLAEYPDTGKVFRIETDQTGQYEHQVTL